MPDHDGSFDTQIEQGTGMAKTCGLEQLHAYKGKHAGARAFIIGNGPSLRISDLDLLSEEITFACNKIYLAFPETAWKPTYYTVEDHLVAQQNQIEIEAMQKVAAKLFPHTLALHGIHFSDSLIYPFIWKDVYPALPDFSDDAARGFHWGSTVVYTMLQLAAFMGIREVYLMGIDFSFSIPSQCEGTTGKFKIYVSEGEHNHFHPDYRKPGEHWHQPNLEYQEKSFLSARNYFETHGGRIFNATRGGCLECFPRIDLDTLLFS
jgi:hypothetical protein